MNLLTPCRPIASCGLAFALTAGLPALLTGCASPPQTTATDSTAETAPDAPPKTAPETASETAAGPTVSQDADYMAVLGLMKGHLLVAKELIDKGDYEGAEPHIGHPVEELYSNIEADLEARGVPEFRSQLNALHELVMATPTDAKTASAYDTAMASIDGAIAAIPSQTSPEFVKAVLSDILATAEQEYEGSIANGQFAEVIEYQDSRGFVLYANDFYAQAMPTLAKADATGSQTIADNLAALKAAWPEVTPPPAPVMSPEEVAGIIQKIEETSL